MSVKGVSNRRIVIINRVTFGVFLAEAEFILLITSCHGFEYFVLLFPG